MTADGQVRADRGPRTYPKLEAEVELVSHVLEAEGPRGTGGRSERGGRPLVHDGQEQLQARPAGEDGAEGLLKGLVNFPVGHDDGAGADGGHRRGRPGGFNGPGSLLSTTRRRDVNAGPPQSQGAALSGESDTHARIRQASLCPHRWPASRSSRRCSSPAKHRRICSHKGTRSSASQRTQGVEIAQ